MASTFPLKEQRYLGLYLLGLCLYQVGIYQWPGGPPFILDPRAGIAVLLINHFGADNKVIYPVEWISTAWLIAMAILLLIGRKVLKLYLCSEVLLAAPTAYYIAVLALLHGGDFAPAFHDLLITVLLFALFSAIPAVFSIACLRSARLRPVA